MVTAWRRAFCTSIPDDHPADPLTPTNRTTPSLFSSFFPSSSSSQPSTPTTTTTTTTTPPNNLRCKTATVSSKSAPSSPRSPSPFLFLKTSLSFSSSKSHHARCGICSFTIHQPPLFSTNCSHSFHSHCISSLHSCPICLSPFPGHSKPPPIIPKPSLIRLYDDDEPLLSPAIPEYEEESQPYNYKSTHHHSSNHIQEEFSLTVSHQASAVVSVARSYQTCAILLSIKAPTGSFRPSVDLVTVLDVGSDMTASRLHALKKAMRALISSLSSNDRLSIVAFSSTSKRLLPLKRMTPSGRRSARRMIDLLNVSLNSSSSCVNEAVKKAVKVLHDRKEKNQFASVIVFNNHENENNHVTSTRIPHLEIPVHTFRINEQVLQENVFMKSLQGFLNVVVSDLRVQVGMSSGSAPAEIMSVYSCLNRPILLNSGLVKFGDLYSEEEREIIVELKIPAESVNNNNKHILSMKSLYKDPSTKQLIRAEDQSVMVSKYDSIKSSEPKIQRLRSQLAMTKAVRRKEEEKRKREKGGGVEKAEVMTPTSAWKAAERLAKVAIMRKSLNRVSDLHGFEDARF